VDRWETALHFDRYRVNHSTVFTLTRRADCDCDMRGELIRVTKELRRWAPGRPYWAWLELTARGRIHLHIAVLNAPWRPGEAPAVWLERVWGHGHVDQSFRGQKGSLDALVSYVRGYVKKQGAKAYQQDYADLLGGLRTFASNNKGYADCVLDQHRSHWESLFVDGHVLLTARLEHVRHDVCAPTPGQLEMAHRRALYRRGRALGRLWTNSRADSSSTGAWPAVGAPPGLTPPAVLRAIQLELDSEYWEWHRRVYELPW
jgi:hypothetical protein